MARPQVADGGDGLQIWSVAANILNRQFLTAGKVWFSRIEAGFTAKNMLATKCLKEPRNLDGFFGQAI
jgi:hypothetical protein